MARHCVPNAIDLPQRKRNSPGTPFLCWHSNLRSLLLWPAVCRPRIEYPVISSCALRLTVSRHPGVETAACMSPGETGPRLGGKRRRLAGRSRDSRPLHNGLRQGNGCLATLAVLPVPVKLQKRLEGSAAPGADVLCALAPVSLDVHVSPWSFYGASGDVPSAPLERQLTSDVPAAPGDPNLR